LSSHASQIVDVGTESRRLERFTKRIAIYLLPWSNRSEGLMDSELSKWKFTDDQRVIRYDFRRVDCTGRRLTVGPRYDQIERVTMLMGRPRHCLQQTERFQDFGKSARTPISVIVHMNVEVARDDEFISGGHHNLE
jgi:hypothetical protein